MSSNVVIGTRASRLALRQTDIAVESIRSANPDSSLGIEIREIRTSGDKTERSLSEIGGRGVFVIELERALLGGEIDIAVHSLKDLPSDETDGLSIAAVLSRADPRDALVSRTGDSLNSLPAGATVGTGSPRRAVQVREMRSDLRIEDIRGNIDTRIRKVDEGEYDAVVLAAAGLDRLGGLGRDFEIFEADEMLPAVGQGALAVQVRSDDDRALSLVGAADDAATRMAVFAERAFERRLGGGCQAAIAAYALIDGMGLRLRGLVGDENGSILRGELEGSMEKPDALGIALAEQLIADGASEIVATARRGQA